MWIVVWFHRWKRCQQQKCFHSNSLIWKEKNVFFPYIFVSFYICVWNFVTFSWFSQFCWFFGLSFTSVRFFMYDCVRATVYLCLSLCINFFFLMPNIETLHLVSVLCIPFPGITLASSPLSFATFCVIIEKRNTIQSLVYIFVWISL